MNGNILVAGGKESKCDSRSSGERTGNSLNLYLYGGSGRTKTLKFFKSKKIKNFLYEAAESCTIDGESPVVKRK